MPNAGTHIPVGLLSPWIVVFVAVLLWHRVSSAFYDYPWLWVVMFVVVASFIGERAPDHLEPPESPRHRGVFHWLIGFLALAYILLFFLAFPYLPWLPITYDTLLGLLIVAFLSGYASHFVLDYFVSG